MTRRRPGPTPDASIPAALRGRGPGRRGFTLIELSIVLLIIGLLVSFILAASLQANARAQQRATQGLLSKLEVGVSERIEALLSQRITPNGAHKFLATIYPQGTAPGALPLPWGLVSDQRAQVIATADYLKRELPDVFYIQVDPFNLSSAPGYPVIYPFNFAGLPYPMNATGHTAFVLPLGHLAPGFRPERFDAMGNPILYGPGDLDPTVPVPNNLADSAGIYGAAYTAAAGLYKQLGYAPQGYDGTDNNANGYIDEFAEGIIGLSQTEIDTIVERLQRHDHKTARSEMLFSLLTEGRGPLGSIFTREDFSPTEVADTDGDGLMEFVDAWGEPLQFYRWPIYYRSPIQKGAVRVERYNTLDDVLANNTGPDGTPDDPAEGFVYAGMFEAREQCPIDPNQSLIAPAWWSGQFNVSGAAVGPLSARSYAFTQYFFNLVEYNASPSYPVGSGGLWWERSAGGNNPLSARRAYFSKFLIASSGPDKQLGIARLAYDYNENVYPPLGGTSIASLDAFSLILIENTATPFSPFRLNDAPFYTADDANTAAVSYMLRGWGQDDITNHTLQLAGGGIQ